MPLSLEEITALYHKYSTANRSIVGNRSANKPPSSNGKDLDSKSPEKMVKQSFNAADLPDAQPDAATFLQGGDANVNELGEPSFQGGSTISKLLDMLMSYVHASLPAAFSPEVGQVEKLLMGSINDGVDNRKNKGNNEDLRDENIDEGILSLDGCPVVALSLGPDSLKTEGDNMLFYKLADKIIRLMASGAENEERGKAEEKFLQQTVESDSIWPTWLNDNYTANAQVPLGLILLAGFELSINSSYGRSLAELPQNIKLHIGGESPLQTKIERLFCVRQMLMADEEKVVSLVSKKEWSQLESSINIAKGTFKGEHLLTLPLQWIALASPVQERCEAWNASLAEIWSKMAKNRSSGVCEKIRQQEEEIIKDLINAEELTAPVKKKKKKSKKKV